MSDFLAHAPVPPNNALERAMRGLARGAAGASEEFAPAAPGLALPRPAQRRRKASALQSLSRNLGDTNGPQHRFHHKGG